MEHCESTAQDLLECLKPGLQTLCLGLQVAGLCLHFGAF